MAVFRVRARRSAALDWKHDLFGNLWNGCRSDDETPFLSDLLSGHRSCRQPTASRLPIPLASPPGERAIPSACRGSDPLGSGSVCGSYANQYSPHNVDKLFQKESSLNDY